MVTAFFNPPLLKLVIDPSRAALFPDAEGGPVVVEDGGDGADWGGGGGAGAGGGGGAGADGGGGGGPGLGSGSGCFSICFFNLCLRLEVEVKVSLRFAVAFSIITFVQEYGFEFNVA